VPLGKIGEHRTSQTHQLRIEMSLGAAATPAFASASHLQRTVAPVPVHAAASQLSNAPVPHMPETSAFFEPSQPSPMNIDHGDFQVPAGVEPQSYTDQHIKRILDLLQQPSGLDARNVLEFEEDDIKDTGISGDGLDDTSYMALQRALALVAKAKDSFDYAPWPSKGVSFVQIF
jgi:hypothetical protein